MNEGEMNFMKKKHSDLLDSRTIPDLVTSGRCFVERA